MPFLVYDTNGFGRWEVILRVVIAIGISVALFGTAYGQRGPLILSSEIPKYKQAHQVDNAWPDFGIAAFDSAGKPIAFFGQDTPFATTPSGEIQIPGYVPPANAKLQVLPGAQWSALYARALTDDPASIGLPAPEDDTTKKVREVIASVQSATDVVSSELCNSPGHPATFALEMEMGFDFYVSGSTKVSVEWDLDTICPRYEGAENAPQ